MKIFKIPNPYDYHEQGELLIKAETKEEAIKKAQELAKKGGEWEFQLKIEDIEEWVDDIYENDGCDC